MVRPLWGLQWFALLAHAAAVLGGLRGTASCEMSKWGEWTKCSEKCGTGVMKRERSVIHDGDGGVAACPGDQQIVTCNVTPCDMHPKAQEAPLPSAHGYVSALFHPKKGFSTSEGEQAACLLDKTQAYADLIVALFKCKNWHDRAGGACYADAGMHLVSQITRCCEGREHMVLWASNVKCDEAAETFLKGFKSHFLPGFEGCVEEGGQSSSCDKLRGNSEVHGYVLRLGLQAAQTLYAAGKPSDLTKAARQWLHVCDASSGVSCGSQIKAYLKKWGIKQEPAGDARA